MPVDAEAAETTLGGPQRMAEVTMKGGPGFTVVGAAGALGVLLLAFVIAALTAGGGLRNPGIVAAVVLAALVATAVRGLFLVAPAEAVVVQRYGRYIGTVKTPGPHWTNPLADRRRVSLRARTYETAATRVNDADGAPIELSVVIVWQVVDTARALYDTEDYERFLAVQCEAAARQVAAGYRYDDDRPGAVSLCRSTDDVAAVLSAEVEARVSRAGVAVVESRVVRLSYAPEIASAMLRRQQAGAVVAARQQIVDGAVGMVELALHRLEDEDVVDLDEERKAAMVSNLLVVLCSDHATQPIVNAGSLYH